MRQDAPYKLGHYQEQDEIVKMLAIGVNKTKVASSRRYTLKLLFNSMLHQLMAGEVRMKEINFS